MDLKVKYFVDDIEITSEDLLSLEADMKTYLILDLLRTLG